MGFQALVYGGTFEGFGLGARGRIDEPWGSLKQFRQAYDEGHYTRVGELSAQSTKAELKRDYTLRFAMKNARDARKADS